MNKIIKILLLTVILSGCMTLQRTQIHWCNCKHPTIHCFYTDKEEICYCTICSGYISVRGLSPNEKQTR